MTFIMAQRFGKRILLLADTKISDPSGVLRRAERLPHAHNYVPGRLKIFPLNLYLSVGYAGRSGKALNDLRALKKSLDDGATLSHCLQVLRSSSAAGDIDYLLISHVEGAEIYKIANGSVAFGQTVQWIGDAEIAVLLQSAVQSARGLREASGWGWDFDPEYGTVEEHDLSAAWTNLLLSAPTLTPSVGGIPIRLLGSPYGHSFANIAGVYNPSTFIMTSNGITDEGGRPVNPLDSQYGFSFLGGAERGAPVAGLWLQESGGAYLYDPITNDEAIFLRGCDDQGLATKLKERALKLGGRVIDLPPLDCQITI